MPSKPFSLILLIGTLILAGIGLPSCQSSFKPVNEVDPFIGSVHCRWFFFTPASVPMGMAKLGPHTDAQKGNPGGWEPVGYDYRHTSIEGFGHFHEFQIGGLVVMPTVGDLITVPGDLERQRRGYRSGFEKETETARPGYYSVNLTDYKVQAELSATKRVGYHRYTFPSTTQANIIIDIGNVQGESGPVKDAFARITPEGEIEGYVITNPVYVQNYDPGREVRMFFVIRPNRKPSSSGAFIGDGLVSGNSVRGKGAGLYIIFNTTNERVVELQAGLSYTSIENARLNLNTETAGKGFDRVVQEANSTWNNWLGRIEVKGGNQSDRTKLYTGLYHALLGRGVSSDVNGAYPSMNGRIGQIPVDANGIPEYQHFNTDAMWGAFWNLTQVWGLAYPDVYSEFVRCQVDHYKDCGWLPDGTAAGCMVPGVPSNFMSLVIASAWNLGIHDFDIKKGFEAALKNETCVDNRPVGTGKYDVCKFVKDGYIPYESTWRGWNFSASHTLEYSFSSWAVGQLAKSLEKNPEYLTLTKQAKGYRFLFDDSTHFMRPRHQNGRFYSSFQPDKAWIGFQEGNSWQYSWYVPHDVKGLIDLMGVDFFNQRLDSILTESEKNDFGGGKIVNSFSGLESVYNHGNQPSLQISWLFNYSGKPWLTQKWVRKIGQVFYGTEPLHGYGYGQDEDQGQLGAWYVLSGIGLFDVQGGASTDPTYQLASPSFDEIIIHLNQNYYQGKEFTICVHRESAQSQYIAKAKLNRMALNQPWIEQKSVINGGTLDLWLKNQPDTAWGAKPEFRPPSVSDTHQTN
ncbi:MAG: GH92 family glycosyl hydrolase [Bacteroidales bacterium]